MKELFTAIWGAIKALLVMVLDACRDFFEWLKKPGSKLRCVVAVMAFVACVAGLRAYQAEQRIVLITQQCETDKGRLNQGITERDDKLAKTEKDYKAERDIKNAQILRAEAARKVAEAKAKEAEKSAAKFRAEYAHKTPACTQALTALKASCPTLEDF